jgi:hypothetical protein
MLVLAGAAVLAIDAVFAPWAFFLGGRFHPLAFWQGFGRLHSPQVGDYAVFVRMWPTPGGHGYASVTGSAFVCTARGERYPLRLAGGFLDKRIWVKTDGERMQLSMYRRGFWSGFFSTERRPRLDLHGSWHDPDLVMDDHGTFASAFLPDGSLYLGPPRGQPQRGAPTPITLRDASYAEFDAACRSLTR